ncbi:MAG: fibronectin type III domain-containing protein [Mobilicoccus sp.]|nr:fibronectin type III domain-containing protein [Mobilicoccus sp.]
MTKAVRTTCIASLAALTLGGSFLTSPATAQTEQLFDVHEPELVQKVSDAIDTQQPIESIVLGTGSDGSERYLVWYTDANHSARPMVEVVKKADLVDGEFPAQRRGKGDARGKDSAVTRLAGRDIRTERAIRSGVDLHPLENNPTVALDRGKSHPAGQRVHKTELKGLEPDTEYVYRIGHSGGWLRTHEFRTAPEGNFQFFVIGDAQIGASYSERAYAQDLDRATAPDEIFFESIHNDTVGWGKTLHEAVRKYPDIALLVSAGDQVELPGNNWWTGEWEYRGYTLPPQMQELGHAATLGNHDWRDLPSYDQHYNLPNYDVGNTRNHWWGQNDVLFLHLNTELRAGERDTLRHRNWMKRVLDQVGDDYTHKVVVLHRSLYPVANHATTSATDDVRKTFLPLLDEFDIPLVLAGHDHSYVRTHVIDNYYPGTFDHDAQQWNGSYGDVVSDGQPSEVFLETGQTISVQANSSSGSKYYTPRNERTGDDRAHFDYISVYNQERIRNYTVASVTKCSFQFTTHRATDSSVVDDLTVYMPNFEAPKISGDLTRTVKATEVEGFDALAGLDITNACDLPVTVSGELDASTVGTPQTITVTVGEGDAAVEATMSVTVEKADTTDKKKPGKKSGKRGR